MSGLEDDELDTWQPGVDYPESVGRAYDGGRTCGQDGWHYFEEGLAACRCGRLFATDGLPLLSIDGRYVLASVWAGEKAETERLREALLAVFLDPLASHGARALARSTLGIPFIPFVSPQEMLDAALAGGQADKKPAQAIADMVDAESKRPYKERRTPHKAGCMCPKCGEQPQYKDPTCECGQRTCCGDHSHGHDGFGCALA